MGEKNIQDNKTCTKSALISLSKEIENVADKVSRSVVSVHSRTRGNGSGVVWTSDGLIVTCSHIVKNLDEYEVSLSNGKSFPAKVIGNDPYSDIALLKIQANGENENISLNPIEIGDSENLRAGQFVLALANPYGQYPSITEGIITSERSSLGGSQWGAITDNIVITDARLNPGYSGGPLVDVEGKMIGLNAAYVSSRGIAIRASKVRNISDHLAKDGSIKIAYLGIVTDEISLPREIGAQLEPSQEEGLIILSVEKDSAAKKAGLLIGDIIVKFDDEPITDIHDLRRQLLKQDVIGKSVKIVIIRGEKKSELTLTPGEASRSG
ncbi:MAG TPA: trypsin-like peptidase domain-containing protein [Candidatus Bathyarchaeia archaeon]|nr:trypsin-like peptidase domain-containing protein [Candidatus Bathyarchaeia archaeon]